MAKRRKAKGQTKRPRAKKKVARRGAAVKRSAVRKRVVKKKKKILKKAQAPALEKIGEVTHYFPKVNAAAVLVLKDSLRVGDEIYIKGHTTDFKEKVTSMELDHAPIKEGRKGQEIGLLVSSRVRGGDSVYRI